MAKETMIVFIYDTECLKDEADDPVTAVLYFHPSWVSDTQKVALCGQLMGTSYFLRDCFFKPKIISLQNGKFVLKDFGRFVLAVGTDRNISDYLLENRALLLSSLIKFYHRDLETLYEQYASTTQSKNLSEKLYHIFETYLPILQCNGNIFHNIPKLRMPKTASGIFLEAIQTLQCCQQTKGVLGGAILYHNKVVATQLDSETTKHIVLTDPLHIRTTAEQITSTDFHIPNGVMMLVAYIDSKSYRKLQPDAQRAQNLQTTNLGQGSLPFQYAKRKMKRDKSLIFTHIPEESSTGNGFESGQQNLDETNPQIPMVRPKSLLIRPTHLPLRSKTSTSKELPESGIASINFDETDSYPEFIGRTSVCSTPMAENKVLQVGNIMSICANPEDSLLISSSNKTQNNLLRQGSLKMDFEKFMQNFMGSNSTSSSSNNKMERRNSFTDLQDSLKKISKKLSLKQISNGFKTDVNRNGSQAGGEPPDFIENDGDDDSSENSDENNKTSRTITDPTNPMFNANGQPMSRSLFQEFLEKYYRLYGDIESADEKKDSEIAQLLVEFKEFDEELKKLDECLKKQQNENGNLNGNGNGEESNSSWKADKNLNVSKVETPKTPFDKKALSLPLKPLAFGTPSSEINPAKPLSRRPPGGVPLTPLMAKLSVLAAAEQNPAWDSTPAIEIQTPLNTSKSFSRKTSLKCEEAVDALASLGQQKQSKLSQNNEVERVELYLCGQQNMTLILLMEEGSAYQHHIVKKMFDICVAKFPHMESHLNKALNVNVEGDKRDGDYSFICLDAKWQALQRKGPWNPVELNTLEYIHRDFYKNNNITDMVLRSHDSVFYGYNNGRTEFFYKEPVHHISGIPPPSDPMGNVTTRAKTRLQRDHSYNLF